MYTRNLLWLVSPGKCGLLSTLLTFPPTHQLARNKSFVTTLQANPGTLDPQKVEENTAAQIGPGSV